MTFKNWIHFFEFPAEIQENGKFFFYETLSFPDAEISFSFGLKNRKFYSDGKSKDKKNPIYAGNGFSFLEGESSKDSKKFREYWETENN